MNKPVYKFKKTPELMQFTAEYDMKLRSGMSPFKAGKEMANSVGIPTWRYLLEMIRLWRLGRGPLRGSDDYMIPKWKDDESK